MIPMCFMVSSDAYYVGYAQQSPFSLPFGRLRMLGSMELPIFLSVFGVRQGSCELYTLGGGLGRLRRPKPPPLGRCGGARVPSGCPLRTSPTVKLIAARRNLVFARLGEPQKPTKEEEHRCEG